jgi:hypothetical protein
VVDLRIYRACFVLALLSILVVMFSLQERPAPLSAPIAPDAFKGAIAYGDTARLAKLYPDRKPGSDGSEALGTYVEARFRALGLETTRDRFHADYDGEDVRMSNVVGVLNAPSDRQVLVMAPRDAAVAPGASSASSTAVMLQLAQALAGSSREKTYVFVSLDGAAADNAGARRFAERYSGRDKVDAALLVDEIGAAASKRPFVVPWATGARRTSLQVARTADAALARESAARPRQDSWVAQFLRQAWPVTLRGQGPLVSAGYDAVTMTAAGEVPHAGADGLDRISSDRLQTFGRAALGTASAYDSAREVKASPRRYLVVGRKVIPDWAISLLAVGLVMPALIASFDAFARARRRGLPIGAWMRWALAGTAPFALTFGAAWLFQQLGWLPDSVSEALAPATKPSAGAAAAALAALAALFAGTWLVVRPLLAGRVRSLAVAGPAPAVALGLVLAIEVLAICVVNPFTALVLAPAVHLCVLAALPDQPRRAVLAGGIVVGALALPAAALLYYGARLDLGADPFAYALLLVESAVASIWTAVLGALVAGTLTSAAIVAAARSRLEQIDETVTVRGPASYAGPGSLGGTESALRR